MYPRERLCQFTPESYCGGEKIASALVFRMSHSCLLAGRRVLGAADWGHRWATSLPNFNIPKRRTIPSAAPVTSRLPLWLKAVQLIAMGSGSRENCSWKGKSALMPRNRPGGAEELISTEGRKDSI